MLHYFTDSPDFLAVPHTVVIMYNIGFDISRAYYNLNRRVLTLSWPPCIHYYHNNDKKALVLKTR